MGAISCGSEEDTNSALLPFVNGSSAIHLTKA